MRRIMEFADWTSSSTGAPGDWEGSLTGSLFQRFVSTLSSKRPPMWSRPEGTTGPKGKTMPRMVQKQAKGRRREGMSDLPPEVVISMLEIFQKIMDSFDSAGIVVKPVDQVHYQEIVRQINSIAGVFADESDYIGGVLASHKTIRIELDSSTVGGRTVRMSSDVDMNDICRAFMDSEKLAKLFIDGDYDEVDVYAFVLHLVEIASKK
jgi:hypothetical protein